VYWTRRFNDLRIVSAAAIPAVLLMGLFLRFPLNLVPVVGVIALSTILVAREFNYLSPYVLPTTSVFIFLIFVFLFGVADAINATGNVTNVHKIEIKGGEIKHAIVLRTFEKGVLLWSPGDEMIEFVRWEQIDEMSHPLRRNLERSGCRLLAWFCRDVSEP
jgi:hypothetical protein